MKKLSAISYQNGGSPVDPLRGYPARAARGGAGRLNALGVKASRRRHSEPPGERRASATLPATDS